VAIGVWRQIRAEPSAGAAASPHRPRQLPGLLDTSLPVHGAVVGVCSAACSSPAAASDDEEEIRRVQAAPSGIQADRDGHSNSAQRAKKASVKIVFTYRTPVNTCTLNAHVPYRTPALVTALNPRMDNKYYTNFVQCLLYLQATETTSA